MQEFSDNLSTLSYVSKRRLPMWIWDSQKRTIFGRTPLSWTLCILFYLVYYTCLAGFFTAMMMVFLYTQISSEVPTLTGEHSILALKAGLGFRPIINVQKSLISFSTSEPQKYLQYSENIETFMKYYYDQNGKSDSHFAKCNGDTKEPNEVEKVCKFPVDSLGPCSHTDLWGYQVGKPCVLLKVNKIYGWLPDIADASYSQQILINCTGQNPADTENIKGINYYPSANIDGNKYGAINTSYFPYIGQRGYVSPLVAVQFENITKSMAILVECQLQNVKNAYDFRLNFEVQVDQ